MNYQYSYLIGDLVLLAIWLILFFWRKDIRKEMLIISLLFGVIGLLVEFVYVVDWWVPLTITKTKIGIEDFIFGFVFSGIAATIYGIIFRKRAIIKKPSKNRKFKRNKNFILIILLGLILFFGSFYVLRLNSFYASIIAFVIPILIIWVRRKDLIVDSLVSGFLLIIIVFFIFTITEYITPGWVNSVWHFKNISKIIILKAPLEDIIWGFLAGANIGPLYEYWKEGKVAEKK